MNHADFIHGRRVAIMLWIFRKCNWRNNIVFIQSGFNYIQSAFEFIL